MADDSSIDQLECPSENSVINLANRLLSDFNIDTVIVAEVEDISAAFFVVLFERLFSTKLPGIIRQPQSREDEIHNCQIVIDVMSTDIIHDNLSHITGLGVVDGNINVIYHLLDIFSYLLDYVSKDIVNDTPIDYDESRSLVTSDADAHDLSGISARSLDLDRIVKARGGSPLPLPRKNGNRSRTLPKSQVRLNTNENRCATSHKDFSELSYPNKDLTSQRAPSPIRPDDSQSLLGHKTIDSEFSVENLEKKDTSLECLRKTSPPTYPKAACTDKEMDPKKIPSERDEIAAVAIATTDSLDSIHYKPSEPCLKIDDLAGAEEKSINKSESSTFSASLPASLKKKEGKSTPDKLYSTVGPITYTEKSTEKISVPREGFSTSLDDLRSLVEKTAAMTRFALDSSPVRTRTLHELDLNDPYIDEPRPQIPGEGARLAKELNSQIMNSYHNTQSVNRGGKKVAFSTSTLKQDCDYDRGRNAVMSNDNVDYFNDYGDDKQSHNVEYKPAMKDISDEKNSLKPQRKPRTKLDKGKTPSLVSHLSRNRQPELGAAHMTLKTEDRALARKQNILRKMYDEDLGEFTDEVNHILDKESKKAKETGDLFKKNTKAKVPTNKLTKKSKASPSDCKKPRIGSSKTKNPGQTASKESVSTTETVTVSPQWHLESDEDLLPLLLEEFPHLQLSEHTWHELWRRGLNQIQTLTHAYAKSQQKKSREQNQLEEAARRHELLGDMMKKQIDHSKRLREIKDQKQLQAHMRNKAHDKKIQSARARKYYNEYQVRARGKQLKRNTKEELVFRDLFKEALDIQKERIKDIRSYANDQRKKQETRRQNEIDSMENFYRDQFDMLSERLCKERYDTEIRETAQKKVINQMKRELRKKMESEIQSYQESLLRDEDNTHWRYADADRVKQKLHTARYNAKI